MNRNDIINKKFSHSFTGYDISEVDLFLDEIINEFDKKNHEKGLLEFKIEHEFDVALKYIRLLRKQLEEADIQPERVPVSISDSLKELTEKEDARENTESAQDRELFKSVHAAIAASDRICTQNSDTAEDGNARSSVNTAEISEAETGNESIISEKDKNNYETYSEITQTEKPAENTDKECNDGKTGTETEKKPEENGKHRKKRREKKEKPAGKSRKKNEGSDYEEYDVNRN